MQGGEEEVACVGVAQACLLVHWRAYTNCISSKGAEAAPVTMRPLGRVGNKRKSTAGGHARAPPVWDTHLQKVRRADSSKTYASAHGSTTLSSSDLLGGGQGGHQGAGGHPDCSQ